MRDVSIAGAIGGNRITQLSLPDKKPCTVPGLENGKYHGTVVDAADHNRFSVAFQDFDTVQSGELLMVTCDTGYIVNVSSRSVCLTVFKILLNEIF